MCCVALCSVVLCHSHSLAASSAGRTLAEEPVKVKQRGGVDVLRGCGHGADPDRLWVEEGGGGEFSGLSEAESPRFVRR